MIKSFAAAIMYLLVINIASAAPKLPADIQKFIETREGCDHFRGEPWDLGDEPEYKDRREFIFARIKEYCKGTDKKLAKLRLKYRQSPSIISSLRGFEDKIE